MNTSNPFGEWLKTEREQQGYSKNRFAAVSGVDRSHIYRMEKGEIGLPETPTRARIHAALGTNDEQLVERGILTRREYSRPDGTVEVVYELASTHGNKETAVPPQGESAVDDALLEIADQLRRVASTPAYVTAVRDSVASLVEALLAANPQPPTATLPESPPESSPTPPPRKPIRTE